MGAFVHDVDHIPHGWILWRRLSVMIYGLFFMVYSSALIWLLIYLFSTTLQAQSLDMLATYAVMPGVSWTLGLDRMSASFALVIVLLGLLSQVYAIGYTREQSGLQGFIESVLFNAFIVSMLGVVLARDMFFFLWAWETMSLLSFLLLMQKGKDPAVVKAGTLYVIMTHTATGLLFMMFLLLARVSGGSTFQEMAQNHTALSPLYAALVFIFSVIGFGTKAGLVPFHSWLPEAHPLAPSHVSALMSGVMITLGYYGLLRILFDFLPPAPLWWGIVLMGMGAISTFLGILYGLLTSNIKRFLAYSSIENSGLLALALGASLVAKAQGKALLAGTLLAAFFFHLIVHALFKSGLFMGAGILQHATGTLDVDRLGGLIRRMPDVAAVMGLLMATMAVLPPLAAFTGEWMMYRSYLDLLRESEHVLGKMAMIIPMVVLAFSGMLTMGLALKHFARIFLATPRSEAAAMAQSGSIWMRLTLFTIALLILIVSAAPVFVYHMGTSLARSLGLTSQAPFFATLFPLWILTMIPMALLVFLSVRVLFGRPKVVQKSIWATGVQPHPQFQMTSYAFSQSLALLFKSILGFKIIYKRLSSDLVEDDVKKYVPVRLSHQSKFKDWAYEGLYLPVARRIVRVSERIRRIQSGNVQMYLAVLFAMLIGLLWWIKR